MILATALVVVVAVVVVNVVGIVVGIAIAVVMAAVRSKSVSVEKPERGKSPGSVAGSGIAGSLWRSVCRG